uniref:Uncharacterized protein n=1 Tax=Rhizophora mucronata TaxID=61149 RepID=A0A2P2J0L8_RHIMU
MESIKRFPAAHKMVLLVTAIVIDILFYMVLMSVGENCIFRLCLKEKDVSPQDGPD